MQNQLIKGFLHLISIYQSSLMHTEEYYHFSIYVIEVGCE